MGAAKKKAARHPYWAEFVRLAAPAVLVGEHRIVYLRQASGLALAERVKVAGTYANRRAAVRVMRAAETRQDLSVIGYLFERYSANTGAVWTDEHTVLVEGRFPRPSLVRT